MQLDENFYRLIYEISAISAISNSTVHKNLNSFIQYPSSIVHCNLL